MFKVSRAHIKRVSFLSRLYPINAISPATISKARNCIKTTSNHSRNDDDSQGLSTISKSKNYDILEAFGFIKRISHGTFAYLPPFLRSIEKLTRLVETELEYIGGQKVVLPSLVPEKWWIQSNRLARQPDAMNDVYKLIDRKKEKRILAPTHEESITNLVASSRNNWSEKRLPIMLYQTTPKFRDEPRAKFGLLRSNEFIMNDLYSFDADYESAKITYENVCSSYTKIFKRLGLDCLMAESFTGNIGGEYSHEYQLPISIGEDRIITCKDCCHSYNDEMSKQQRGRCLKCDSTNLEEKQSYELGHSFILGTTYSQPFEAVYISKKNNSTQTFQMGCYGLGITRIIAAGIELLSNDQGLRWPNEIEPYKFVVLTPKRGSKVDIQGSAQKCVEKIVNSMMELDNNIDVLIDDREDFSIGKKLLDAQALGIPNIIVIGGYKFLEESEFEFISLNEKKDSWNNEWLSFDDVLNRISTFQLLIDKNSD